MAEQYRSNWNYGNAIHDGHIVLGKVSLAKKHIKEAKAELIKAGHTPGSPQLNLLLSDCRGSFFPASGQPFRYVPTINAEVSLLAKLREVGSGTENYVNCLYRDTV